MHDPICYKTAASRASLAELVDALDSKSSSTECGFESHSWYVIPAGLAQW